MRKCLATGFVIILPLAVTFWIVTFLIGIFTGPFIGIAQSILQFIGLKDVSFFFFTSDQVVRFVSQIIVLAFLFGLLVSIGAVARHFFFGYIMHLGDKLIQKIPVISSVYKTSKDVIKTVLSQDAKAFKQVVLVPFPHNNAWTVGLITRNDHVFGDRVSVFVPTTPNPTTGYLLFYDKSKVIPIDMKVDDALRFIVSCGVLMDPPKLLPQS